MQKGERIFLSFYKKLNPAQKKAVDTIEGPVMVIAGPGTGKTQILTLRIANILRQTDTAPEQILALTFTESGVFSMRKRLVEIIGSAGYRVRIHTFHGFANDLIREYPDAFPKIIGATHIHDVEKTDLVKELLATHGGKRLRPFGDPFFYVSSVKGAISEMKREYLAPAQFKKITAERKKAFARIPDLYNDKGKYAGTMKGKYARQNERLLRDEELAALYGRYEDALARRRRYDYDDMVVEAVRALEENSGLLLSLQEEHQYILADEHQDANRSQNRILELLASFHENPNLFVVGDEKQAIYRFQGASLENFRAFKRLYPAATVIALTENYRSTQPILDAAHSLIARGASLGDAPRVRLLSQHKTAARPPALSVFSRPELQYVFIAEDIKKKIAAGVPAEEIAVLYRENRDALPVAAVFEKTAVPFAVESDQDVLRDHRVRTLLLLLRAVGRYGDDALLTTVLHMDFFNLKNGDVYKALRYAGAKRIGVYDTIGSEKHLRGAGVLEPARLRTLAGQLDRWKTAGENMPLLSFLETLINESGFLPALLAGADALLRLKKLNALFDDIKTLVGGEGTYGLRELLAYFDTLEEHNLPLLSRSAGAGQPGKVRLMTAHKAKGLEFDFVYIVDSHDGKWGGKREMRYFTHAAEAPNDEPGDKNDDERRLFYVALTRARNGVHITHAEEGEDGAARLPSQFIEEIAPECRDVRDTAPFEKSIPPQFFLTPPPSSTAPLKDKEFLNTLFLEQGLSVTALNNYLACPWSYFYNNLLRLPRAPGKSASFGTAAHAALKARADALAKRKRFGKKAFIDSFLAVLAREPLSREDYDDCVKKGKEVLGGYYDFHKNEKAGNLRTEMKIETEFSVGDFSIPLRGMLDKVEFLHDGAVRVTDYKTGRIRSRNEIEGKTKSSDGGYKRQLVFYKLLLSRVSDEKSVENSSKAYPYGVRVSLMRGFPQADGAFEGAIAFVEPDKNGRYREESFEIADEEVAALKDTIIKAAKEIHSLAFWNARCGDRECRYCALRDLLGDPRTRVDPVR